MILQVVLISENISQYPNFCEFCGIKENEIEKALLMIVEDKKKIKNILDIMRDNYNGYRFSRKQNYRLYNTTLVIYFLKQLSLFNEIPENLIDPNLQISETGLSVISTSPFAQEIMTDLHKNDELYIKENIEPTLSTKI
jgi:hypothetical protein